VVQAGYKGRNFNEIQPDSDDGCLAWVTAVRFTGTPLAGDGHHPAMSSQPSVQYHSCKVFNSTFHIARGDQVNVTRDQREWVVFEAVQPR
jgi:hypothetical protein